MEEKASPQREAFFVGYPELSSKRAHSVLRRHPEGTQPIFQKKHLLGLGERG